jgi:outer membrane protein
MNMKSKIAFIFIFLCSAITTSFGQSVLKIDDVINNVLHYNFDVLVGKQDATIASNNSTKGNAGLQPTVQLNAGGNFNKSNTEIIFAGGIPPTNLSGAQNVSYNSSISAAYTLFNGFANLRTYEKLQTVEQMSLQQLRLTIENAVVTTIGIYLDLGRMREDEVALKINLDISRTRMQRIQVSRDLGSSSSLDLLNAQVDYNADSVSLLNLQHQLDGLKRQINLLMGTEIISDFTTVQDNTELPILILDQILTKAKTNNSAIILADLQTHSSELDVDIARANTMPIIGLTASYGFNSSKNQAGILLEQNNLGLNSGINVTIPIFNGGKIKIAMANSEVNMAKNELLKQKNIRSVEKEVYDHWMNYLHQLNLEEIEKSNLVVAEKNLNRAKESFKLGQITSLEYRQAQLAQLSNQNRLNASKYEARKEAYHLLRLQGELINN